MNKQIDKTNDGVKSTRLKNLVTVNEGISNSEVKRNSIPDLENEESAEQRRN